MTDVPRTDEQLLEFYRAAESPWVRAVMVRTRSGHVTGAGGTSRDISGPQDLNVMTLLRAMSDVVMVGARTANVDHYGQIKIRSSRAHITGRAPRLCIVSGNGTVQLTPEITAANPIIITSKPRAELFDFAEVLIAEDLKSALTSLFSMGLTRIDCEGGPGLLRSLLDEQLVDEVDLTISPLTGQSLLPLPRLQGLVLHDEFTDGEWVFQRHLRKTQ